MHKSPDLPCSSLLTIDLSAIRSNYVAIAARVAPSECGAVVKANAYGLGAKQVVRTLSAAGCRHFFVAHLNEAFAIADLADPASTIAVLNGLNHGAERACAKRGFLPVLNSGSQVKRWRELARDAGRPLPAILQIDSGMSRLGLSTEQAEALARDPNFVREVELRLLMTHLACADEPVHPANTAQLDRFNLARSFFPGVRASIANSGGSFLPSGFHLDVARPGIALFGVSPDPADKAVKPVLTLSARILQIREVPAGTGVGYGLNYIAPEPSRLATVAIGYADGWPRHLSSIGSAWHDGTRLPITGRISMDSLTVDISALPAASIAEGDFVELIGPSQSVEAVAHEAGTIAYELLTQLGQRHQRTYVDEARPATSASGDQR